MAKISYLFTDRHGGLSSPPYDSFNLAYHVGDDERSVQRNRDILKRKTALLSIVWMDQIHSNRVHVVDTPLGGDTTIDRCDAIVTDLTQTGLAVMVADCIPLLLYDTKRQVIAAAHAGRNGTFLQIAPKTVRTMQRRFGCDPGEIHAVIGPSIGPCCYEIGEDLAAIVEKSFGKQYMNDRYLDIQRLNVDMLTGIGVKAENIDVSPICSACSSDHYSYRREGTTGRFAGLIWME
jgi:YfiH family protein